MNLFRGKPEKPSKTVRIAFTVDVDRTAAEERGSLEAGTKKGRFVENPDFVQSKKGLVELVEMLDGMKIRATFFFEGRTAEEIDNLLRTEGTSLKRLMGDHEIACHGLEHENYLNKTPEELEERLRESIRILNRIFGDKIKIGQIGHRAPYLKSDEKSEGVIRKYFGYDSSSGGKKVLEEGGLTKIPVYSEENLAKPEGYLWKLMEGKKEVVDYEKMVLKAALEGVPLVVLATHPWHHRYSYEKGRAFNPAESEVNLENVGSVLTGIRTTLKKEGFEVKFVTLGKTMKLAA